MDRTEELKLRFVPALLVFAVSSLVCSQVQAQQTETTDTNTPKEVRVVRVETLPVIDGLLDEDVWLQAEVITDFHQTRPGDGTPPSEPTEVYLLYTEDALYIGARMYDSEPHLIAAPTIRHGQGAGQEGFIVLNYNVQDEDKDNNFASSLSDLSIKFQYTFRF